jgi:type I restriction enzyme M protein
VGKPKAFPSGAPPSTGLPLSLDNYPHQIARNPKKDRPLTGEHFAEFEKCFGKDPNGRAKRKEKDSKDDRWRPFHISEVKGRSYKLDGLKWLKDDSLDDPDNLPEPEELVTDAIEELRAATEDLNAVLALLENGAAEKLSQVAEKPRAYKTR